MLQEQGAAGMEDGDEEVWGENGNTEGGAKTGEGPITTQNFTRYRRGRACVLVICVVDSSYCHRFFKSVCHFLITHGYENVLILWMADCHQVSKLLYETKDEFILGKLGWSNEHKTCSCILLLSFDIKVKERSVCLCLFK